jgi:hypothetical protein
MRGYVPQRQMLPVIASSISSSVGCRFLAQQHRRAHQLSRLAVAALRNVLFQPRSLQADYSDPATAPRLSSPISRSARETGATHERTASPLICTVQAPHCAMPHPYFVPVRPKLFADHPQQRGRRINVEIDAFAVNGKTNHCSSP